MNLPWTAATAFLIIPVPLEMVCVTEIVLCALPHPREEMVAVLPKLEDGAEPTHDGVSDGLVLYKPPSILLL